MYQTRQRRIETIKRRLLQRSMPRLQVALILLFTGLAGFLASFVLLRLGIGGMWLRYPLAILFAYGTFLLLLRFWLSLQRSQNRNSHLALDLAETGAEIAFSDSPGYGEGPKFGEGDAGGGGAGGSWEETVSRSTSAPQVSSSSSGSSFDLDLDEGWLIIIAIVALIGGLIASLYVIYIAPVLLAEILVDGVLLAGLYRRVNRLEQRHWLQTAVRRTVVPGLLVVVFFTLAGYALQKAVPQANTIGEVWKHWATPH